MSIGRPPSAPAHPAGTEPARAWRPRSAPEQLAVAGLGAAGAAVAYQATQGGEGLWLPCPLRAGFTLVMAVLMAARAIGWLGPPARWPASRRRQSYWVAGVLAAASWAFQLHRFGWV